MDLNEAATSMSLAPIPWMMVDDALAPIRWWMQIPQFRATKNVTKPVLQHYCPSRNQVINPEKTLRREPVLITRIILKKEQMHTIKMGTITHPIPRTPVPPTWCKSTMKMMTKNKMMKMDQALPGHRTQSAISIHSQSQQPITNCWTIFTRPFWSISLPLTMRHITEPVAREEWPSYPMVNYEWVWLSRRILKIRWTKKWRLCRRRPTEYLWILHSRCTISKDSKRWCQLIYMEPIPWKQKSIASESAISPHFTTWNSLHRTEQLTSPTVPSICPITWSLWTISLPNSHPGSTK